eukprot:5839619-Pyramimonas_sp.AAC.1
MEQRAGEAVVPKEREDGGGRSEQEEEEQAEEEEDRCNPKTHQRCYNRPSPQAPSSQALQIFIFTEGSAALEDNRLNILNRATTLVGLQCRESTLLLRPAIRNRARAQSSAVTPRFNVLAVPWQSYTVPGHHIWDVIHKKV